MADDLGDKADNSGAQLIKAYALLGEASAIVRTVGDGNVRLIAPYMDQKALAAMLRMAADSLDVPKDRTLQ